MRLYDEVIGHILEMLADYEAVQLPVRAAGQTAAGQLEARQTAGQTEAAQSMRAGRKAVKTSEGAALDWPDLGKNNMVLRSGMAYELGGTAANGAPLPAIGITAVTANRQFVPQDEILLYGRNLSEISQDTPYARIALARVSEDSLGEGNTLYNAIKRIEYTRYHVNPKGFMMRISSIRKRETVRIGRDALAQGLDFAKAGNLMLRSFRENPKIEAVKLVFINLLEFPYKELEKAGEQADAITGTLDHMMKNLVMDCEACSLQKVCDEVEGLRELHFPQGKSGQTNG